MISTIAAVPTVIIAADSSQMRATALREILRAKPKAARWAVLAQPRLVPLDDFADSASDVVVRVAPPGCACCVGNVPFRVALTRLVREARPDALVIELAAADHLEQVRAMLVDPWFAQTVALSGVLTDSGTESPVAIAARLSASAV